MKYKDRLGGVYRTIKKDGRYLLVTAVFDKYAKKERFKIEVEGKENVFKYIKNNQLEVSK